MMKDERGFTLLELMIVVAIIAIIASILVPNFFHARAQAAVSACESNLRSISTAAELYFTDFQSYPGSPGQKVFVNQNFGGGNGKYLTQTPTDPASGPNNGRTPEYTFQNTSTGNGLYSYLITCPGVHDSSALQTINGGGGGLGSGGYHITYDSATSFGVVKVGGGG
jgi:prepilin-type N-terminal cleavage/methylation domain-containing protein